MTNSEKDTDQEKGDDVLRRMLKTPPDHLKKMTAKKVEKPMPKATAK